MAKIGAFVSQVRIEMGKVAWPTKQELMGSTTIVLISTFLLALYIGMCDLILSRFVRLLISGAF